MVPTTGTDPYGQQPVGAGIRPAVDAPLAVRRWAPGSPWTWGLCAAFAVAGGAFVAGAGWAQIAVVAAISAGAAAALWAWVRRRIDSAFGRPVREAGRLVELLRTGTPAARIPERGAPAVQHLTRRLNETLASVLETHRRGEAELLSVEIALDRIRSVLQSIVEGVAVVDGFGEVVLANPTARDLMIEDGDVVGRHLVELLDGTLSDAVRRGLAAIAGGAEHLRDEVEYGDRVFDVDFVRVRSNRPDQDFGSVVMLHDVTARHEVARLKDEFLSSVSHELRTPLTNICAYAEIVGQMSQAKCADCQEFLDVITSESQRLTRFVNNVLDYVQVESGQVVWRVEPIEVRELVAEVVELFDSPATDAVIDVDVDPSCAFAADRDRLRTVLVNLVDNAIKFGEGRVRVEAHASGDHARIAVHDDGRGVAEADRERVFHKLEQLGDTLTDKPAGAGLGLALSHETIAALGGSIECQSSDLGGAKFVVELPLAPTQKTDGRLAAVPGAR